MTAHAQLVELDLSDNAFGPIGNIYTQVQTEFIKLDLIDYFSDLKMYYKALILEMYVRSCFDNYQRFNTLV